MYTLCIYLPIYKVSKIGIAEKVTAYLGSLSIYRYSRTINTPYCVTLKVQIGHDHNKPAHLTSEAY